jgi:hypothetical protein
MAKIARYVHKELESGETLDAEAGGEVFLDGAINGGQHSNSLQGSGG